MPEATPTATLNLLNNTSTDFTLVETSPRDPQSVLLQGQGSQGELNVTDTVDGNIYVIACTGFVGAWMNSASKYNFDGTNLTKVDGSENNQGKFEITNSGSETIWCIIASGGKIEDDVIPGPREGEMYTGVIYMPATDYVKMIICTSGIRVISPAIPWNGQESISRWVTVSPKNATESTDNSSFHIKVANTPPPPASSP